jgi:hypothetical protein
LPSQTPRRPTDAPTVRPLIAALLALHSPLRPLSRSEAIEYRDGDTKLKGYLCDDAISGKRPGVIVVHGGGAHDDPSAGQRCSPA